MGRAILCTGTVAKIPYVLEKQGFTIYTVEELCYCIREHTILMDETLVCRELIDWLREECGLCQLADSLYGFLKTKASVSAFLTTILEQVGFYPKAEVERIEKFLKAEAGLGSQERQKRAADYLAENERYGQALVQYEKLLKEALPEDKLLRAKVLHNMGCVSGRLLQLTQAAEYFQQAYELSGEKESLLQLLTAKRMLLEEKQYVEFIIAQPPEYYQASMELEKRVEQVAAQWKGSKERQALHELREQIVQEQDSQQDILADQAERLKAAYRNRIREK